MAQYIVKRSDTLAKIAKKTYDDASLSKKLAEFNGLQDENHLLVGQQLELPTKKDLIGKPAATPARQAAVTPAAPTAAGSTAAGRAAATPAASRAAATAAVTPATVGAAS